MRTLIIILIGFYSLATLSQDTLRVMHYNLLNFGNNTGYCNQSNNNYQDKTDYLKIIIEYLKPDILTVNEISNATLYHDYILNNALNVTGTNYYVRANPPNYSNSPTVNQIYFNTEKLSLTTNVAIETNYRDIDIFRMQYTPSGQQNSVVLNCVVAHLKAGDDYEDEVERASETNKLMNFLDNTNATGNYIFSGDFNVYTASEQAFKNLLFHSNEDIRFYDPINKIGHWHDNSYFADVHTQSTHTSGNCFAGGGLDDRFDFILVSDEIIDGADEMKYIANSYEAIGQDGQHFNKSLISSPENTSVPEDVLYALYGLSDHLPVVMEMLVSDDLGFDESPFQNFNISFRNPVKDYLEITSAYDHPTEMSFDLMDISGNIFYSLKANHNSNTITIPVNRLNKGLYLLKISDKKGHMNYRKVIKL